MCHVTQNRSRAVHRVREAAPTRTLYKGSMECTMSISWGFPWGIHNSTLPYEQSVMCVLRQQPYTLSDGDARGIVIGQVYDASGYVGHV